MHLSMKTRLKTPSSHYSKADNRLDIVQPTSLRELSQAQLRYVLECKVAGIPDMQLLTYCFFRFSGLKVERDQTDGVLCSFRDGWRKRHALLSHEAVREFASMLAFINEPSEPARLDMISGCRAADPFMHGVTFEQYLMIEGFWYTFLQTKEEGLLLDIAKVLYRGRSWLFRRPKTPTRLTEAEKLNVIYWLTGWKVFCGEHWSNFFRRVSDDVDDDDAEDIESAISLQIRALTGGDITKMAGIMSADVWDALTELDFLAQEAQKRKADSAKNNI